MILREGSYKLKQGKVWLPALIRVESSKDDDGRRADRPRLVLWIGAERHERPLYEDWAHKLHPVSRQEFDRLSKAHTPETASPQFNLATASPMF